MHIVYIHFYLHIQSDQNNSFSPIKMARFRKCGEPIWINLRFKDNQPISCDADTEDRIRKFHDYLS